MRPRRVIVNDLMQRGYSGAGASSAARQHGIEIMPDLASLDRWLRSPRSN